MILFVDYNDVFRAPMAAIYYKKLHGRSAESAGVYTDTAAQLGDAVRPRELDDHSARQINGKMIAHAEKIYCMTAAIAWHLREEYPAHAEKIFVPQEIPDPMGQGKQAYRESAELIRLLVEAMK